MNEYKWTPCSECLPNVDEIVLIYLWKTSPYLAWVDKNGKWQTEEFEVDEEDEPTEWMPVPKPSIHLVDLNEISSVLAAWLLDDEELN